VVLSFMASPHDPGSRPARADGRDRARHARPDAVVRSARRAAAAFERWLGMRPRVIAPGVDLEAFAPARARRRPTICGAADHTQRASASGCF